MMKADATLVAAYAEALFESAKGAGTLDDIAEGAKAMGEFLDNQDRLKLRAFLETPSISRDAKEDLIVKVFQGKLPPLLLNFARMLIRRGRIEVFRPAIEDFYRRYRAHQGLREGTVVSGSPIDSDQRDQIEAALSRLLGARMILNYVVDPRVIGGIRFLSGDTLIDTTLETGLHRLRDQLGKAQVF